MAMTHPPVDQIVEKIVEACNPRRVVVFGSRARGEAGPESDLDLFVEMESDKPPRERIRCRTLNPLSVDVRYPPIFADPDEHEASAATAAAQQVHDVILKRFP